MEYLYTTVYPKIKLYVLRNSGNEDDSFDIFQDGVVCLCKTIQKKKFDERYEISAFLYSVCRNLWINKVKKEKRSVRWEEHFDLPEQEDFSENILTDQKIRLLKLLTQELGEKCFKLLQYAISQEKSNTEIYQLMGFATVNSVKTQKYKCKQRLMKLINNNPDYQEVLE